MVLSTLTELGNLVQLYSPIFTEQNFSVWNQICNLISEDLQNTFDITPEQTRVFVLAANTGMNNDGSTNWLVAARNQNPRIVVSENIVNRPELLNSSGYTLQQFNAKEPPTVCVNYRLSSSTETFNQYATQGILNGQGTVSYVLKLAISTTV